MGNGWSVCTGWAMSAVQARSEKQKTPELEAPGAVWMAICNSGRYLHLSRYGRPVHPCRSWRTDWLEAFASWSTVVPD